MAIVCVSFVESFFGECIMVIKKVLTEINTVRTFFASTLMYRNAYRYNNQYFLKKIT